MAQNIVYIYNTIVYVYRILYSIYSTVHISTIYQLELPLSHSDILLMFKNLLITYSMTMVK